jgi:hypothetical protein
MSAPKFSRIRTSQQYQKGFGDDKTTDRVKFVTVKHFHLCGNSTRLPCFQRYTSSASDTFLFCRKASTIIQRNGIVRHCHIRFRLLSDFIIYHGPQCILLLTKSYREETDITPVDLYKLELELWRNASLDAVSCQCS